MAEEIVGLKIQVDGSDVGKSVGSLKQQLREAQNEVNALSEKFGATSKEAINAAKKAAELKDAIGDAKALTDAFNPDAKFKALTASLSGVAGGFAAVQGAIGLFGAESKEVEQTLLKVQSAMAFSQGIQAVGESVDSFKQLGAVIKSTTAFQKINNAVTALTGTVMKALGFSVEATSVSFKVLKGAIAATGIGLLVVAVGELVNAFQNYQSAAEKAKKAQDDLNESANKGAKVAYETELASIERTKALDVARAKNKGASEQEIFNIEQSASKRKIESQKRFIKDSRGITVEDQIQQQRDLEKQQNDIEVAQLDFQTKQNQQASENSKKKKEQRKQEAADAKAEQDRINKEIEQQTQDRYAREDAAFQVNKKAYIATLSERDKELLAIEDEYEESRATLLRAGITNFTAIEEEKRLAILELNKKYDEEQKKAEQELFDWQVKLAQEKYDESEAEFAFLQELNKKKKEEDQKVLDAKIAIQMAEIDLLGQLSGVLKQVAGKNKAIQAAAIIAENAAGIGRIIINTQVANAKAAAASPLTLGQPWVTINTISGALGVASSLLATKKALSDLGGGGSAGSAPNIGGGVGGSAPLAPSSPQAQLTQLDQTSINRMGSATGRAYVVESDITNSQEKIIRINRAARLG